MDPVDTSLIDAVRSFFFPEAGRVGCQCLGKLFLLQHSINEFSDHGVLTCSDQVQVLSLDLIHHGIHLRKTHNSGHHVAPDHERRHTVCESSVDHEISRIGKDCGVKSCDIAHQIVEAVSSYSSGALQVDAVEALHDLCMVRNLKVRNYRLTEFLDLYVLA